ncbi:MAG: hypothetical protein KatS3mg121_1180 [Gammaproteobacteria bacterium]|nr:MAG: hypothetical protein KatS3mg121_1180 [Gammaproteobacteria bacterium]
MDASGAFLGELQARLAHWYEIEPPCPIAPFVLSDRTLLARLLPADAGPARREQLLVAGDGERLAVSLFLDAELLRAAEALARRAPAHDADLDALWLLVEGVSHFLHLTWRATTRRPVSALELELHGEIDKFLYARERLLEAGAADAVALYRKLFEDSALLPELDAAEAERYLTASRYAARFCRRYLAPRPLGAAALRELRRFYRLPLRAKMRHIDGLRH